MPQIREGLQNVAEIGLASGARAAGPSLYNASTPQKYRVSTPG